MPRKDLNLTKDEKAAYLDELLRSPYIDAYIVNKVKQTEINQRISEIQIEFDSEDSGFKAYMKWLDSGKKLAELLDYYMDKLDPKQLKEAEEKITTASRNQLESRVKNKKKDD